MHPFNESIVSPVARRYTRVVKGRERLVVCLSECPTCCSQSKRRSNHEITRYVYGPHVVEATTCDVRDTDMSVSLTCQCL